MTELVRAHEVAGEPAQVLAVLLMACESGRVVHVQVTLLDADPARRPALPVSSSVRPAAPPARPVPVAPWPVQRRSDPLVTAITVLFVLGVVGLAVAVVWALAAWLLAHLWWVIAGAVGLGWLAPWALSRPGSGGRHCPGCPR